MGKQKAVPGARQRAANLKTLDKRNSRNDREHLTKLDYTNGEVTLNPDGSYEWTSKVKTPTAEGE